MDRRAFIKLVGLGAGAAALPACSDAPVQNLYASLKPPNQTTPGLATRVATVCRDCPAGCSLIARTREGRPIKLEGNPHSPINQGALCLRGQSALQGLYHPARFSEPLLGEPGRTRPVSPEKALGFLGERLRATLAAESGETGTIALLTGVRTATGAFFYSQLASWLKARWVSHEPVNLSALRKASSLLFDRGLVPRFDLSRADLVLSLGADLLECGPSPVEHARQLAELRASTQAQPGILISLSPRMNLTDAAADEWISVRPGSQGLIALALLSAVLPAASLPAAERQKIEGWLAPYPLAGVAAQAGLAPAVLERLAARLRRASAPLVLPPAETLLTRGATFEQAAVLLLNYALGTIGRSIRYGSFNPWSRVNAPARLRDLLELARDGKVAALFVEEPDPAYFWPDAALVEAAFAKIPLVVQIAERPNDTSRFAHLILPGCHFLEAWGDHQAHPGWIATQQPTFGCGPKQRQAEDWLLAALTWAGLEPPWKDYRQCLAQFWTGLQQQLSPGSSSTAFFKVALSQGGLQVPAAAPAQAPQPSGETRPAAEALPEPPAPGLVAPYLGPLQLVAGALPAGGPADLLGSREPPRGDPWLIAYASPRFTDPRTAGRPWLQEHPDPLTQVSWDTPLEIGPALAARLGLADGDRVEAIGVGGKIEASIRVLPHAREDVAALPLGGGRAPAGRLDPAVGCRALSLLLPDLDPVGGGLALVQTTLSLRRLAPGRLVTIEGEPHTHGRPLLPTLKLSELRAGARVAERLHARPGKPRRAGERARDSFTPAHEFPEHQWGLAVDLDRCNGCGACMIACQAENNVPTAGPAAIQKGRQMFWLEVLRYWEGERPRFLPLMCQQCENAPCEPVCPVFASYHTRDGLNGQVYNRCIGTRYCSNNCPYKVRRFNWFQAEWPAPQNLQLNPDVTVRGVGVMEKCTFCIQRIRAHTNRAKAEGRAVTEGEIVPACAQTCPTGAIVFGDRKQADSRVRMLAQDPRAYRLLDTELNTLPAVTYLCRVDREASEG